MEKVKGKGKRPTVDGNNSFFSPLPSNLDLTTAEPSINRIIELRC